MASAYETETMRYQRAQAASGLESLRFQIKTSKLALENMCGMAPSGTVDLDEPGQPTEAELAAVSFEQNLKAGRERNVDVQNAQIKYDADRSTANEKARDAAENTFAANFRILCLTVPEKSRLVDAARQTEAFRQRTLDIAKAKYDRGLVSYEEYLSAQSDLDSSREDLKTAQLDLLTAYRNYVWAVNNGIA